MLKWNVYYYICSLERGIESNTVEAESPRTYLSFVNARKERKPKLKVGGWDFKSLELSRWRQWEDAWLLTFPPSKPRSIPSRP